MRLAIATQNVTHGQGQGRVNLEIAARALACGHQVYLVAARIDPALRAHPRAQWVQVPVSGWPTEMARNLVFGAQASRWLRRNREHLDIIHVNGGNTWAPSDVNAVHFVHSAWLKSPAREKTPGPRGWYYSLNTALNVRWEQAAFRQARTVVAVSESVRDELAALGVPDERIRVIPNGVDCDEFRPGPADRGALGLPQNVPLGIFVGDLRTSRKNLDTVLRALTLVPDAHLAVADSTEGSPYPAMAKTLGVGERVHFLGYRRDTPLLMRAADFCVCPSRYEPFSLVLLEALASACPVITARTVGAATLAAGGAGIVLDDAEDAGALAEAMRFLSVDPARRAQMGQIGRAVAERHTWTEMADAYLSLYEELSAAASVRRAGSVR